MLKTNGACKGFKSVKERLILFFYKVLYRNSKKKIIEYASICSLLFFSNFKPEMRLEKNERGFAALFLEKIGE